MLRRELAIALGAPIAWVTAALGALLIGHGFVLAIDLYSAASRSALAGTLQARELDPLAGVVRPTLGGLYLAISLLVPLVATRTIAVEKQRRGLEPLILQTGSPLGVLAHKALAALASAALVLVAPMVLLSAWRLAGGHLALGETATALAAHALYLVLVTAIAVAAAAWTESLAQAAVATLVIVAASWAIDASEGFAALAWMGRVIDWSVTTHLQPMERGTIALGALLWLASCAFGAVAIAWLGLRFDLPPARRALCAVGLAVIAALGAGAAHRVRTLVDCTELHRASLPPGVVAALRRLPRPPRLEVWLDRDDARRQQLEAQVLSRLRLARADLEVTTPLDDRAAPAEGEREPGYGRIVVAVGDARRETYSTSRKELVSLLLEAADEPAPDWSQAEYPGYPTVIDGERRSLLLFLAYAGLPLVFLAMGWRSTRSARRTS